MAYTALDVKELREKTGVGMMDCKKALEASDGDMDKAIEFLREKGLAAATKKAGRIAAEGVVLAYTDEEKAISVLVEVNAETDFVAKNEVFQNFVLQVAKTVAYENPADVDALLNTKLYGDERTVQENLQDKILAIGENMKVRRFERVEGVAVSYIHGRARGVLVTFDTDAETANKDEFKTMGKDVAMQVAALNPTYLDPDSIPAEVIEREKEIEIAQMKADPKMANKPEQILAKIVEGKMGKYYSEVCLMNQPFVKDDKVSVAKYVEGVAKKLGADIKVTGFICMVKGEGLEKREENFANEIASMIK